MLVALSRDMGDLIFISVYGSISLYQYQQIIISRLVLTIPSTGNMNSSLSESGYENNLIAQ